MTNHSPDTVLWIFERLEQYHPPTKIELEYYSPFTLLVAVILSARTTDRAVNIATRELFKLYDTPEKVLKLGEEGLKSFIKNLGLYNTKAKNIIEICRRLTQGESIVADLDTLMKFPGVGRKTANVILNCLFEHPTIAVDTHVSRVSQRLGLSAHANKFLIEQDLLKIVPREYLHNAHSLLVLHGRYICKSRKPLCDKCVVSAHCPYFRSINATK